MTFEDVVTYHSGQDRSARCCWGSCARPAWFPIAYYKVERRRVSLWACVYHHQEHGYQGEVKPPEWIAEMLADEARERSAYEDRMRKRQRGGTAELVDLDVRSVRELSPTGHGKVVPVGRVESWRWGTDGPNRNTASPLYVKPARRK